MKEIKTKSDYCKLNCKAWCCRNLVMFYKFNPTTKEDDALFFSLRGIKMIPNDGQLIVPKKCNWLTEHNICRMYAYRPQSCRVYQCTALNTFDAIKECGEKKKDECLTKKVFRKEEENEGYL